MTPPVGLKYAVLMISAGMTAIYFYIAFFTKPDPETNFGPFRHSRSYAGFTSFLLISLFLAWMIFDDSNVESGLWKLVSKYPNLGQMTKAPHLDDNGGIFLFKTTDTTEQVHSFYLDKNNQGEFLLAKETNGMLLLYSQKYKLLIGPVVAGKVTFDLTPLKKDEINEVRID